MNNTHTHVKLAEPVLTKATLELGLFSRKVLYQWISGMVQVCAWRGWKPLHAFGVVSSFSPSSLQKGIPLQAHRHYLGGAPEVQEPNGCGVLTGAGPLPGAAPAPSL